MQFLEVPFEEKDDAKALGARWHVSARRWYVPTGLSLTPFVARWNVSVAAPGAPAMPSNAVAAADLIVADDANDGNHALDVAETVGRTYVHVPFKDKDICKHAGGRWDAGRRCWFFISDDAPPPAEFSKWTPYNTPPRLLRDPSAAASAGGGRDSSALGGVAAGSGVASLAPLAPSSAPATSSIASAAIVGSMGSAGNPPPSPDASLPARRVQENWSSAAASAGDRRSALGGAAAYSAAASGASVRSMGSATGSAPTSPAALLPSRRAREDFDGDSSSTSRAAPDEFPSGMKRSSGHGMRLQRLRHPPVVDDAAGSSCPICLDKEKDTALMPCGHVLCHACARSVSACPICRGAINDTLRLYL